MESADDHRGIQLYVRQATGKTFLTTIYQPIASSKLKQQLYQPIQNKLGIPPHQQLLYLYGQEVANNDSMLSVRHKSILHVVNQQQLKAQEISITVVRLDQHQSPNSTIVANSNLKLYDFLYDLSNGIHQLFLVSNGRVLDNQMTFKQQHISNNSTLYCLSHQHNSIHNQLNNHLPSTHLPSSHLPSSHYSNRRQSNQQHPTIPPSDNQHYKCSLEGMIQGHKDQHYDFTFNVPHAQLEDIQPTTKKQRKYPSILDQLEEDGDPPSIQLLSHKQLSPNKTNATDINSHRVTQIQSEKKISDGLERSLEYYDSKNAVENSNNNQNSQVIYQYHAEQSCSIKSSHSIYPDQNSSILFQQHISSNSHLSKVDKVIISKASNNLSIPQSEIYDQNYLQTYTPIHFLSKVKTTKYAGNIDDDQRVNSSKDNIKLENENGISLDFMKEIKRLEMEKPQLFGSDISSYKYLLEINKTDA